MEDGVAEVRLNRPDKLNALDPAMFVGLVEAGDRLAHDFSVRAVVLSGAGSSFSSGLDVAGLRLIAGEPAEELFEGTDPATVERVAATLADPRAREQGRITNLAQQAAYCWTELPVPVIAAVQGHAVGGGLQIALGADMRVVAPDARLTFGEVYVGLVPDMAGIPRLAQLVRYDIATLLVCTGRQVDAREAVGIGLATLVEEDPRAAALRLARQLAGRSPDAVRAAKRLLAAAWQEPIDAGLLLESDENARLIGSANQVEAVRAYVEHRDPDFADPKLADDPIAPAPRGRHSR